jgi:hypothetical protein
VIESQVRRLRAQISESERESGMTQIVLRSNK